MTDLKTRLAVLLPEGKAIVEEGMKFSNDELKKAFAQVLAEADDDQVPRKVAERYRPLCRTKRCRLLSCPWMTCGSPRASIR